MSFRSFMQLCFLLRFCLSSCEKVDHYVEKTKRVLKRDDAPKQVVGLPEEEKITFVPPPPEPVKMEPVINKKAKNFDYLRFFWHFKNGFFFFGCLPSPPPLYCTQLKTAITVFPNWFILNLVSWWSRVFLLSRGLLFVYLNILDYKLFYLVVIFIVIKVK